MRSTRSLALCIAVFMFAGCSQDEVNPPKEEETPSTPLPTWASLAVGRDATCGIDPEARVACWGRWPSGRNYGVTKGMLVNPEYIEQLDGAQKVVFDKQNHFNACALIGSGEVWCWGSREQGSDFADPDAHEPFEVEGFADLSDIALGSFQVCGLSTRGEVSCTSLVDPVLTPASFSEEVTQITAHDHTVCARLASGRVECDGSDIFGGFVPDPDLLSGIEGAEHITSHDEHVCAASDRIECIWRERQRGEQARTVIEVDGVEALTSKLGEVCARLADGTGRCWRVQDGEEVSNEMVEQGASWHLSQTHTCQLAPSGVASCRGEDLFGQLGRGESDLQRFARPLTSTGLELLAAGARFTCMRDPEEKLECEGELPEGLDALLGERVEAMHAPHLFPWVAISEGVLFGEAGELQTSTDDPFVAARSTERGIIGMRESGSIWSSQSLVDAPFQGTASALFSYYALTSAGELEPIHDAVTRKLRFDLPAPAETLVALALTIRDSCAWFDSGEIWCEGSNAHGQLGRSTSNTDDTNRYGKVALPGPVLDASFATYNGDIYISHGCAVIDSGKVYCWGKNHFGQLGDGTTMDRTEPVEVQGIEDARRVITGANHTCAAHGDGQISCWGDSSHGQTGEDFMAREKEAAPVTFKDAWSFDL